jgi:hypothetical protein
MAGVAMTTVVLGHALVGTTLRTDLGRAEPAPVPCPCCFSDSRIAEREATAILDGNASALFGITAA